MARELVTEQGPAGGITALYIFAGAFRSTEQQEVKGGRKEKRKGDPQAGGKLADRKRDLCVYHAAFLHEVKEAKKAVDKIKVLCANTKSILDCVYKHV